MKKKILILSVLPALPALHEGHTAADLTVTGGIIHRVVLNAALFLRKCSSFHSVHH
jgi:hypothetical protein